MVQIKAPHAFVSLERLSPRILRTGELLLEFGFSLFGHLQRMLRLLQLATQIVERLLHGAEAG